jgi:hypothetical protein
MFETEFTFNWKNFNRFLINKRKILHFFIFFSIRILRKNW